MENNEHPMTAAGRAYLWGGVILGLFVLVALYTRGFGLFSGSKIGGAEVPLLVHQGAKIVIPDGSPLRQRLTVSAAAEEAMSGKLTLPGVVESDPARTAAVLTPLSGRVVQLDVALGDRVEQGQVLVVIDSPDYAQAVDDDDKAADTLHLTEKNLERAEGQTKIGAGSERDLDQARSDHNQAVAEYQRTQSRLKAIGAATDAHGRSRLMTVRAPLGGSVTTLAIAPGNLINDPTQPMMTIADLSTVWVTALVPEYAVGRVAKGQEADVTLAAYPGESYHGKVLFVSDVIEPDSRRDKLRIAFTNPHYAFKPNMFASVTLSGSAQPRVVLPTSALLMNNDRTTVFVETASWTFERRVVEPQLEEGSTVAIGAGLKPGERVVVRGGILLND